MKREDILRRWARIGPAGGVSRCDRQKTSTAGGKVVFASREAALRCAAALYEWTPALLLDAYECPHGRHFHLTKAAVVPS